jgi:hypothetical protein
MTFKKYFLILGKKGYQGGILERSERFHSPDNLTVPTLVHGEEKRTLQSTIPL